MSTALVLFRRDLRVADNPALDTACAAHARVLPVFIHAPGDDGEWAAGAASRWWLHHSLAALERELRANGAGLHLGRGDPLEVLRELVRRSGADAVYWNRLYEPAAIARDTRVKSALRAEGIAVHSHNATLWREPWQTATRQGDPYKVFTPYWRNLRPLLQVTEPLPAARVPGWHELPGGLPLAALELLPRIAWAGGLAESWRPGAAGARELLELFADDAIGDYAHARDLPARHGTSRLSPHLHFGEISPQQIHFELDRRARATDAKRRPDLEPYLRELGWREFAHHLLWHFPHTAAGNFNPRFDDFPWAPADHALLERWRRGRTGIPLVDAGMRELWHTGWMHNRVRMIVGSFLTKNLRQHWRHGARWFWDTLVDADLASNTLGWQWVAGCGADAAPYFRVFNPVTQARKFDPSGDYLRRWLPELASAPLPLLHEPWTDTALLKRSGYPVPMIDLGQSRQQALDAYASIR
ncbi:deoxyribodipyrimidine photolyase [Rhodanobacter sp. FW510-R12]|uniref:cryptochrome/photolyase family protein n=1 Tax=unclassified Rhodanobacter TaxID=2621553 RepID=UPI0007A99D35|nr:MULTISPECIES: deoxyribodipyrimidine photo-lyase [unclassified Rhodanobacter]KZC16894.1 deoxyribodipyrimidine photolyase [Rhodanobacter sp. FW104-R8]KZC27243.1 deoxyribodipyrimidine photolyase [Rhodanobacter sp. FW510-T8]KZC31680.1 deoxyribodipyrimidine photolyase [Rhodanobacter sp. FW510-R10]